MPSSPATLGKDEAGAQESKALRFLSLLAFVILYGNDLFAGMVFPVDCELLQARAWELGSGTIYFHFVSLKFSRVSVEEM